MNRSPSAPPSGVAPRLPSGWRARLARDPIPILLREGPAALAARVRRDLIDDDEARPAERALGPDKVAAAVATLRALERMAELGLDRQEAQVARAAEFLLASQT